MYTVPACRPGPGPALGATPPIGRDVPGARRSYAPRVGGIVPAGRDVDPSGPVAARLVAVVLGALGTVLLGSFIAFSVEGHNARALPVPVFGFLVVVDPHNLHREDVPTLVGFR